MKSPVPLVGIARSCRSLDYLNISRTRLKDFGASHVVSGLLTDKMTGVRSPHTTLRFLALEENRITASTGSVLAQAVAEMPSLEVLLLAGNELGDEGVQALASVIGGDASCCTDDYSLGTRSVSIPLDGPRLTRLDVSKNQLTAYGLISLVTALGTNSRLRSLELGGNEKIGIGITQAEFAYDVASGLLCAKGLRRLHLWRCGFRDDACNLIAESLPPNIEAVNLASNLFSAACRHQLLQTSRVICL
jgi:Leucine-rich repeat (LRR) protein